MRYKLLLCLLLFPLFIQSQHYIISTEYKGVVTGVVKDEYDDYGLPGVVVIVKGTTSSAITDIDGKYTINVPSGNSTLVFSFLGYQTQEFVIDGKSVINVVMKDPYSYSGGGYSPIYVDYEYKNPYIKDSKRPAKQPDMSSLLNDKRKDTKGVAYMSDNDYTTTLRGEITNIKSIIRDDENREYYLPYHDETEESAGYEIILLSSSGWENVMNLPLLQSTYSQGYNNQWQGAENNQPFSWGAAMSELEFDGSNYSYDLNGKLTAKGTGNGTSPKVYDPTTFFKTGFITTNNFTLRMPSPKKGYLQVDLKQNKHEGTIRNSGTESYIGGITWRMPYRNSLSMNVSASYGYTQGKLMSHGSNLSSIIGAVYTTPASFDNTNGMNPSDANKALSSWLLPDGTIRSYNPLDTNNPYAIAALRRDRDENKQGRGAIDITYNYGRWMHKLIADIDLQNDERRIGNSLGYAPYPSAFLYDRTQDRIHVGGLFSTRWNVRRNVYLHGQLDHHYSNDKLKYNKYDASNYTPNTDHFTRSRNSTELSYGASFNFEDAPFEINISNRHYFSSTANDYLNLFPSAFVDVNLGKIFKINYIFSLKGSFARSLREASLISGSENPMSMLVSVGDYQRFVPTSEVFSHSALKPEIFLDKNISLTYNRYQWNVSIGYHDSDIDNFTAYRIHRLENVAKLKNTGWKAEGYYSKDFYNDWKINILLQWYKTKTRVKDVTFSDSYIPMAGFSEIQTVLAKDQPLGAIYGSDFLRNASGQVVIDADGYPIKDPTLRMIGDPTPDWKMNVRPQISWKKFSLLIGLEAQSGGDIWNGTQAYLDYLGRSQTTANQRNVKGYIFDGVTQSGQTNTQAVDFMPANFRNNRWTRYGVDGVGTEYIEDASYLRMSELTLTYRPEIYTRYFRDLYISFTARNLFIVTDYKGGNPSSTLFNYGAGTGLDLFNAPAHRSFMFTVGIRTSDLF